MSVMRIPPKRLYIMQGIPGSGKSTLARILLDHHTSDTTAPGGHWLAKILSTDEFWGERYEYDPSKIAAAHQWNQRRCVDAMQAGTNYIYIDNTNIKKEQAAPYVALAKMYDYEVSVVRVDVDLDVALARNARRLYARRVPKDVIEGMFVKMERLV